LLLKNPFFCSKATITSISVLNPKQSEAKIVSVQSDFQTFNTTDSNSVEMNFLPNLEDNQVLIITLNTTSANVDFPKNVQLAIYGCVEPIQPLKTKGKIETRKNPN